MDFSDFKEDEKRLLLKHRYETIAKSFQELRATTIMGMLFYGLKANPSAQDCLYNWKGIPSALGRFINGFGETLESKLAAYEVRSKTSPYSRFELKRPKSGIIKQIFLDPATYSPQVMLDKFNQMETDFKEAVSLLLSDRNQKLFQEFEERLLDVQASLMLLKADIDYLTLKADIVTQAKEKKIRLPGAGKTSPAKKTTSEQPKEAASAKSKPPRESQPVAIPPSHMKTKAKAKKK